MGNALSTAWQGASEDLQCTISNGLHNSAALELVWFFFLTNSVAFKCLLAYWPGCEEEAKRRRQCRLVTWHCGCPVRCDPIGDWATHTLPIIKNVNRKPLASWTFMMPTYDHKVVIADDDPARQTIASFDCLWSPKREDRRLKISQFGAVRKCN